MISPDDSNQERARFLELVRSLAPSTQYALYGENQSTRRILEGITVSKLFQNNRTFVGIVDEKADYYSFLGFPYARLDYALKYWRLDAIIVFTKSDREALILRLQKLQGQKNIQVVVMDSSEAI